jgi:type I restriction enzyme S subunit
MLNAADTKAKPVEPKLCNSGWKEKKIVRDKPITKGMIVNNSDDHLLVRNSDYILYYPDKDVISLVGTEAEDKFYPAGIQQAKEDIERLGVKYTYFRERDVLFAKITPCMENEKSAIARNLISGIGFGSTEFHVLRPTKDVCVGWIHFYIRQKSFREEATRNMIGSIDQQRVPAEFLKKVMISLLPHEEQKRIIVYLDKLREIVESVIWLQQKTEDKFEKLVSSILDKALKGGI